MQQIKVPTPRKLPSGSWFIQICVRGHRYSITESTREACIRKATAIKEDLIPTDSFGRKRSLSEAIDAYIDSKSNILSPVSVRTYRGYQRNRFKSAMSKPINTYDQHGWQRLVNQEAKLCGAKTLRSAWGFIATVIYEETGIRMSVNLPQIVSDGRQWLRPEQIGTFLEAIRDTKYEIPALLALHSLRRSEIMALTWSGVNLDSKTISVQGAIVPDENHKHVRKEENKNSTSRRTVPIMIPRLYELLESCDRSSMSVVTMHPNSILVGINKICATAELPEVGLHGLRHSYASLAYHLGMPEQITQLIGGWSDAGTMKKIYTHIAESDIAKHQNAMSEFYKAMP